MTRRTTALCAGFALALAATPALAERSLLHPWGMGLTAGGGVTDFAGDDLRAMTDTAGAWDARFVFGTRQYIGLEAAYIGTAQNINALGMAENTELISNGAEAAVRVSPLRGAIQPYAFAGAAWKRYDLNADTNTSDVRDVDDVLEVPMGIGIGYRYNGLLLDARGSYRVAFDEDLVPNHDGTGASSLDNFNVSAHVGVEF